MRGRLGILPNLGILSVAQIVVQLLNMWALVYLARTIGSHWFGVVQVGVTVSAYALIVSEWGLWVLGIRQIARLNDASVVRRYASRHLGLMVVLATVVFLLGLAVLPLFRFFAEDPWIFIIYLSLVFMQIFMLDWVGIGLERMFWTGVVKICRSLFYALLILVALRFLDGKLGCPAPRWVPIMLLSGHLISNLVMARQVRIWLGGVVRPTFGGWSDWRLRMEQAAPIGAGNVAVRVVMGVDLIVLAVFFEPEVVGTYSAAAKILVVLIIGIEVLWKALLPRLSRLWQKDPDSFGRGLNFYAGMVWICFLPIAWGGLAVGAQLMTALYGEAFSSAGPIFRVLSFSYVALALGLFFGNALIASNRQRDFLPPRLGSAVIALVGCLVLVPRFGPLGACLSMLVAHGVLFLWTGWLCREFLNRRLLCPVLGAIVAGFLMYVALGCLSAWSVWVLIPLGAGVYVLGVLPFVLPWAKAATQG